MAFSASSNLTFNSLVGDEMPCPVGPRSDIRDSMSILPDVRDLILVITEIAAEITCGIIQMTISESHRTAPSMTLLLAVQPGARCRLSRTASLGTIPALSRKPATSRPMRSAPLRCAHWGHWSTTVHGCVRRDDLGPGARSVAVAVSLSALWLSRPPEFVLG